VLLTAPPTPTITLDLEILNGVFQSFNSSHFTNHSTFLNLIFTSIEFFKQIFLPIILNSLKNFEKSYFELMLPTRFEITQSTQNYFCGVGLINLQENFKNIRPSSFVLYFGYTFTFVQKIVQLLFNSCHHKFVRRFLSLPQVVKDQEQTHLVNKIRKPKDALFTITPSILGPFQILKKINDNAYRIDLPSEYDVHSTFNISDLIPFVGSMDNEYQDLRTNPF